MIVQKISQSFPHTNFLSVGNQKKSDNIQFRSSQKNSYKDSFVKHAKQTAPMLLGFTALWAALDYGTKKIPIHKSILNNLAFFFLPVLIGTSALLAGIENKKTSKSTTS